MNFNRNRRRRYSVPKTHDYGRRPYVEDLYSAAVRNTNFRAAIWTGEHLQMTLMSVAPNQEVGLELHRDVDQFLYVVSGAALVLMGGKKDYLNYRQTAARGYGIFVPAGVWHNIVNVGEGSLKLYSVYSPPEHPPGTVERISAEHSPSAAVALNSDSPENLPSI